MPRRHAIEPKSVVAPERMWRFTWVNPDDLDFAPRRRFLRPLWRQSWPLLSWWRRMVLRRARRWVMKGIAGSL